MESKILAGVLHSDTHIRLQAGEQLLDYLRDENNDLAEYEEIESLIGGLANWMTSSNFRISLQAMDLLIMMIMQLKEKFKPHVSTVLPVIREKLGDSKDSVREKTQVLIQQIMQDSCSNPQKLLDSVLEGTLTHKNWRVKEQGLFCITRTLSFFGTGQISVSKYVGKMCDLLGDATVQVRGTAMESLVEIYRHVGVKVRMDLSKRDIPGPKLQQIFQKFDEIDKGENIQSGDETESVSSCSSNTSLSSAKTQGSAPPNSSLVTKRKASAPAATNSGSGGVDETQFEKAFSDVPHINIFTQSDVEKIMDNICQVLGNKKTNWDNRVTALKELRAVIQCEATDYQVFLSLLRNMDISFSDALKDLRSQVVREACVTLSCLVVHLRVELSAFAELMLPHLVALLPNSAKVMASSASVCTKIIIRNCPSHRLIHPLIQGYQTSKSPITRKSCAELIELVTQVWDTSVLDRAGSSLEEVIVKGIKDADPTARKLMRRAFWGYHHHYPTTADRLFNSFDSPLQKHLNDEKRVLDGGPAAPPMQLSQIKPKLKKTSAGEIRLNVESSVTHQSLPPSSTSGTVPAIRVRTATIRSSVGPKIRRATEPAVSKTYRSNSTENLLSDSSNQPVMGPPPRPSSRSGRLADNVSSDLSSNLGAPARPSSRSGNTRKASDTVNHRPPTPSKRNSRTLMRSPPSHHDDSPAKGKSQSMPRRLVTQLTADSLRQFGGGGGVDDDDDNASVTSERSAFSISSEISISPYASSKYPNPITNLDELIKLCCSKSWSERRDGIAQLHLLLESDRELSHSDMMRVKDVFKRMFSEPHTKVYGMFLETLSRFIEEHREYLDDWLFLLLLRLLHKQGTDMLKSVQFKLQLVLEHVRRHFDVSQQFSVLCRILNDQTQPMNNKVKHAWLEYVHELLPLMDCDDFKDTSEIRQAFTKLLVMVGEPKSAEIRKATQNVITGLFDLNAAVFSLLQRGVPRNVQEYVERIIKGYMQENSSEDEDCLSPTSKNPCLSPTSKTSVAPRTPRSRFSESKVTQSLSPTSLSRQISSSSPDISSVGYEGPSTPKVPLTPRSRLPIPSGRATPSGGRATPSRIPRPSSRQGGLPPRARSVDPDRMLATYQVQEPQSKPRDRYQRPTSSQSEYIGSSLHGGGFSNGIRNPVMPRPPSTQGFMLDHFISTLPVLDFGSPDPDGEPRDQVALLLKEIKNASNPKLRTTALQTIFSLARAYENNNWKDHITEALTVFIDCLQDTDGLVRTMALRVLRELIKARPPGITQFTEQLTKQSLETFKDTDCNVSQAAEDLFSPLAGALPPQRVLDILTPMVSQGADTSSLGALKLISKVVSHADESIISSKLNELVPGIVQGYCDEESSVRKASVFCLVEIHGVVGEKLRPHLSALSSSQSKLLDLYIRRHHVAPKNVPSHPTSSEQ